MHEPGQSLNFLGFTLRYDRDLFGRARRYLNVFPSAKAMARARDRVRELTGPQRCFVPIREMIDDINRWAKGWGGYFRHGYPRQCFRDLNRFLQLRTARHLRVGVNEPTVPRQASRFMPICSALACGSCRRLMADSLCMPWTERIRASRVREICTPGLKRAEAAGYTAPPLLDCSSVASSVLHGRSDNDVCTADKIPAGCLAGYPDLEGEDIRQALAYAAWLALEEWSRRRRFRRCDSWATWISRGGWQKVESDSCETKPP